MRGCCWTPLSSAATGLWAPFLWWSPCWTCVTWPPWCSTPPWACWLTTACATDTARPGPSSWWAIVAPGRRAGSVRRWEAHHVMCREKKRPTIHGFVKALKIGHGNSSLWIKLTSHSWDWIDGIVSPSPLVSPDVSYTYRCSSCPHSPFHRNITLFLWNFFGLRAF